MKKIIAILIIMAFNQIYGQMKKDTIVPNSKFVSDYLISDSCKATVNWYEKKECSRKEIGDRFNKELFDSDSGILEKLQKTEYRIGNTFIIDENGILSDIDIRTDNADLKIELKKILESLVSDFRLIDENGKIKKGRFSFPIEIKIKK